ncbi:hypothetical protein K661_02967 [Piscirickettsia salmonis LF-89 = ATCC VR-1361]|nr:hypothetical protein K661_02967 [Piscirickettsia salmonis LF-89 = ATCC VR-1361]
MFIDVHNTWWFHVRLSHCFFEKAQGRFSILLTTEGTVAKNLDLSRV